MHEDDGGYMLFGSCFSKRAKFILMQSIFLCLVLFQLNKKSSKKSPERVVFKRFKTMFYICQKD